MSNPSISSPNLWVSGYYESPVRYIFENEIAVLIASGTGISTVKSVVNKFIYDINNVSNDYKLKKIHVVWSNREVSLFGFMEDVVERLKSMRFSNKFSMSLYLTSINLACEKNYENNFYSMLERFHGLNVSFVSAYVNRPNYYEIYEKIVKENGNAIYGVFASGTEDMVTNARRACSAWSIKNNTSAKINFYESRW